MLRSLLSLAFGLVSVTAALAAEMPTRKAGLWEITMSFGGRPGGRTMQQCTDAATDQMMHAPPGVAQSCSKRDVKTSGNTMIVDSICTVNGQPSTTHMVITGSFDSAYTMVVTNAKPDGAPGAPGAPAQTTITMDAKWLGACKADQKPGDMIMPGGMKMNVIEMQNMRRPGAPGSPPPMTAPPR